MPGELHRDDAEARDAGELSGVPGHDVETMCDRSRCDPEVVLADSFAGALDARPDLGVNSRHGKGDLDDRKLAEDSLDAGASPCPVRVVGAVDPVEELARGDHADKSDICLMATAGDS
jgi:hypothetical protein